MYYFILPIYLQEMINQVSRHQKDAQGQGALDIALDNLSKPAVISQKKEQNNSKHSIQAKITRLYFEELSQAPHATPDSVLVGVTKAENR